MYSAGSFGMLTVQNKKQDIKISLLLQKTYGTYNITTTPGGQIGSIYLKEYESKIENTGTINITGDKSIGIGLLHNIQGVYAGGNIKIGTENPFPMLMQMQDLMQEKLKKQ